MEYEKADLTKKPSINERALVTSCLRVEDTLRQAQRRAERLVEDLSQQSEELKASIARIPEEQRAAGRRALERAAESARRVMKGIDEALGGKDRERDRGQP